MGGLDPNPPLPRASSRTPRVAQVELAGRALNVGRPAGFIPPPPGTPLPTPRGAPLPCSTPRTCARALHDAPPSARHAAADAAQDPARRRARPARRLGRDGRDAERGPRRARAAARLRGEPGQQEAARAVRGQPAGGHGHPQRAARPLLAAAQDDAQLQRGGGAGGRASPLARTHPRTHLWSSTRTHARARARMHRC